MTQTGIIWGSATKVFAEVDYGNNPARIPNRLCIKGGFDERSRAFGLGPAYELEGCFYRDLSPVLPAEHPTPFYAAAEKDQGVVILEDLNDKGAEFAVPTDLSQGDSDDVGRRPKILELAPDRHPYGGTPAGEILVRFGISRAALHRRVLRVMTTRVGALLTREEATEIKIIATKVIAPPRNSQINTLITFIGARVRAASLAAEGPLPLPTA
ncbi:hypothetical protein [Nocardia gamkensis]|uniref:hypothetical protein n=1 Tax=Nocardia gamkensis TaxID=352869 RepID=UPI0037C64D05